MRLVHAAYEPPGDGAFPDDFCDAWMGFQCDGFIGFGAVCRWRAVPWIVRYKKPPLKRNIFVFGRIGSDVLAGLRSLEKPSASGPR